MDGLTNLIGAAWADEHRKTHGNHHGLSGEGSSASKHCPLCPEYNAYDGPVFSNHGEPTVVPSAGAIVGAAQGHKPMTVTMHDTAGAVVGVFTYVGTILVTHSDGSKVVVYSGDPQFPGEVLIDADKGSVTHVNIATGVATHNSHY